MHVIPQLRHSLADGIEHLTKTEAC